MEDITDPEQLRATPKRDRSVCLYGYVRGTHLQNSSAVHIPGCGDYRVADVSFLSDPCPLPNRENASKRTLNERERFTKSPL